MLGAVYSPMWLTVMVNDRKTVNNYIMDGANLDYVYLQHNGDLC